MMTFQSLLLSRRACAVLLSIVLASCSCSDGSAPADAAVTDARDAVPSDAGAQDAAPSDAATDASCACSGTTPVCDEGGCRACRDDGECPPGRACAVSGECAPRDDAPDGSVIARQCLGERPEARLPVELEVLSGVGCGRVSEGRILAVEPWEGGVRVVLHEGFDGGSDPTCGVRIRGAGADVATDIAWASGLVYAASLAPPDVWISVGDDFWTCHDDAVYRTVLYAGASTDPPAPWGLTVSRDDDPGCSRMHAGCEEYDAPIGLSALDRTCAPWALPSIGPGESAELTVPHVGTLHLRVVHPHRLIDCPIGDAGTFEIDVEPASWLVWNAR